MNRFVVETQIFNILVFCEDFPIIFFLHPQIKISCMFDNIDELSINMTKSAHAYEWWMTSHSGFFSSFSLKVKNSLSKSNAIAMKGENSEESIQWIDITFKGCYFYRIGCMKKHKTLKARNAEHWNSFTWNVINVNWTHIHRTFGIAWPATNSKIEFSFEWTHFSLFLRLHTHTHTMLQSSSFWIIVRFHWFFFEFESKYFRLSCQY